MHTFHLFSRACFSAAAATCLAASSDRTFLVGNSAALTDSTAAKIAVATMTASKLRCIVMVVSWLNRNELDLHRLSQFPPPAAGGGHRSSSKFVRCHIAAVTS